MAANLEVVGSEGGLAVLYFHGAASVRDFGPSDELCKRSGIRLFRFCRPGYDNSVARPSASLVDVAEDALSILVSRGIESVVVLGWSGGGPYALAFVFAKTRIVSKVGLIASWAPMSPPDPGLPVGVRFFMRAALVLPRPLLRVPGGARLATSTIFGELLGLGALLSASYPRCHLSTLGMPPMTQTFLSNLGETKSPLPFMNMRANGTSQAKRFGQKSLIGPRVERQHHKHTC
jgi:pimeloyl-ACP methyl ester carboxylesterase